LKAGEASGDLATVLDYMGKYMERINSLKKELTGVFTYPAIVSTVGVGLLGVILVFVAPTFKEVFSESGVPLPGPTKVLFFLSALIGTYYPVLLTVIAILFSAFVIANRSKKGKKLLHKLYMKAPLIGVVIKQALLLRFLRAFDILVNNNVPILETLKVLEEGTDNLCFKDVITEMRQDVSKGLPISGAILAAKDVFPALISNSVAMGEKSGTLGETISRLGNFVDREITFTMKKVSSKLDPILTLGMGSMVLFIALAIYLPIFDMMGTAN
jgi:type IV pilus assembly protein PilC